MNPKTSFEVLETDFDALRMNFVARSGEQVAGEGDRGITQPWVMARLMAGSGLAGRDPRGLVGGSPAVTHAALPKNQEKEKKKKEYDGS